ncbi:hypothetical protein EHH44_13845 [Mycolicibacter terrae]|uniref:Uncharacterized protein n=1 Tax=Mycolicibacter terrae TaxID=1788 RepID=A0ACD2ELB4_9MYCO|nr:hypothetical protein EHH44_13845 [Mycolicibacter terrae]
MGGDHGRVDPRLDLIRRNTVVGQYLPSRYFEALDVLGVQRHRGDGATTLPRLIQQPRQTSGRCITSGVARGTRRAGRRHLLSGRRAVVGHRRAEYRATVHGDLGVADHCPDGGGQILIGPAGVGHQLGQPTLQRIEVMAVLGRDFPAQPPIRTDRPIVARRSRFDRGPLRLARRDLCPGSVESVGDRGCLTLVIGNVSAVLAQLLSKCVAAVAFPVLESAAGVT